MRNTNGKKLLYKVLCLSLAFCLFFGTLPVSAAVSTTDALLAMVVQSMSLSTDNKDMLADAVTNLDENDDVVYEDIDGGDSAMEQRIDKIQDIFSDSITFDPTDISAALTELDEHPSRKATVRELITGDSPVLTYSRTNFSTSSSINKEVNDLLGISSTDENGLKFLIKLFKTIKSINVAFGDNSYLAGDNGADKDKIEFNLGDFGVSAAPIFDDLIGSFATLEAKLSPNADLDGLIAYIENKINAKEDSDITAFKQFLIANGELYSGSVTLLALPSSGGVTTSTDDDAIATAGDDIASALDGDGPIDTDAITDAISDAVSNLTGTDETATTANIGALTTGVIANASELLARASTTAQQQEIISSITTAIDSVTSAAGSITTQTNAVALAASFGTILTEISTLSTSTTSTTGQNLTAEIANIENTMTQVAQQVIANVSSQTVAATVTGTTATVALSSQAVADLLATATTVASTATALQTAMTNNGIDKSLETQVVLSVNSGSSVVTDVKAELPSDLMTQLQAKGIDSVQIAAGIAKIDVKPGFINDASAQSVSLEMKKLEVTSDLTSKMTEEQKELLNGSTVIFDFNAAIKDAAGVENKVSQFNSNITIQLPYTLKAGENKDNITILYLADDGTVKNMVGKYDAKLGVVVFETDHFSKYIVKNNVVKFSDVASTFWASKEIEAMASKGIIGGDGSGKYLPTTNVTRAEFAKLITIALNIVDTTATTTLKDIAKDKWYYSYVATANKAGIIDGNPDGTFAPDATISRQDMAAMLSRALIYVQGEAKASKTALYLGSFVDKAKVANYAVDGVATAIKFSLMNGKPGNQFDPTGKVTKAEAAAVIYRLFNR